MKLESPVKKYPGHVIIPDFMTIPQVRDFEDAYFGDLSKIKEEKSRVFISISVERLLPFLSKFIQEWHIEGIDSEKLSLGEFPLVPNRVQKQELFMWLGNEIFKLWKGEDEIPNA